MRWKSGLLVNEGWTGQRKKQTCNVFTTEIGWASLESRIEVLSPHSNQSPARSQPLGRCSSLWLRAGPRKAFVSAAHQQQLSGAAGVLILIRLTGQSSTVSPHQDEKKAG